MTRQLLDDLAKPTLRDSAWRRLRQRDRGFTMVEMIAVLVLAGILFGVAAPSLLSLNKPLRDGTQQFKNQLSLVRSKAISSSQAYRIRPKFTTRAEYTNSRPNNFVVEYAANCKVTATGGNNGWQMASQFDMDLPSSIGITDVASISITDPGAAAVTTDLTWSICFDNRGIVDTPTKLMLTDFRSDNQAKMALIDVAKVGSVDINTYRSNTEASAANKIALDSQGNPVF